MGVKQEGKGSSWSPKVQGDSLPRRRMIWATNDGSSSPLANGKPNSNPNLNHNNRRSLVTLNYKLSKYNTANHTTGHPRQIKTHKRGSIVREGLPPRGDWEPRVYNLGLRSGLQSNATTPRAITQSEKKQGLIRVD